MLDPEPIRAQYSDTYCRTDISLVNRARRIRGSVMVECGDECPLPPPLPCHSAPFGNWGVDSAYGRRYDGHQFAGWFQEPGLFYHLHQWNSCTDQYYDGPYVNDGRGRQKARPDNARHVSTRSTYTWTGRHNRNTCASITPEVHTERNVTMRLYELDWDGDDHVTNLKYGDMDIRVHCTNSWDCFGLSTFKAPLSIDSTGVSAEARVGLRTSFSD